MFFIQIDDETVITSTNLACMETDTIPRSVKKPNKVRFIWSAGGEKNSKSVTTPFAQLALRVIMRKLAHTEAVSLRPPHLTNPANDKDDKDFGNSLWVSIPDIIKTIEETDTERLREIGMYPRY